MKSKAKTSSETTCYVIAYDIPDDRRRTKIHHILVGFGKWTQYSLFECFLTRKQLVLLRSKLAEHLVTKEDSVGFYPPVCQLRKQGGNYRWAATRRRVIVRNISSAARGAVPDFLSVASRIPP